MMEESLHRERKNWCTIQQSKCGKIMVRKKTAKKEIREALGGKRA